jgi:alkylation response protein AidB-like acyl-CoA dehydrogenase
MNLLPDSDQEEIIASSASFLESEMPLTRLRELISEPARVDEKFWQSCAELGWFGLGLPDSAGGLGCMLADESLLLREIGRSLAPGPYVATVLGARVAALGGAADLVESILAGQTRVGHALLADDAEWSGGSLTGSMRLVGAVGADYVLAANSSEAILFSTADLKDVSDEQCIDDATSLQQATAKAVALSARVTAAEDPVYHRGLVLCAANLVGIAEAARDMSAEHAKARVQFDKPIGVNQAIKHPCADNALRAEAAWAQTAFAAVTIDEGGTDGAFQVLSASIVAADAAEQNCAVTLQILGGMGFTFEADVHLYLKRTQVLKRLLSDSKTQLAELVSLPTPA